jgi:K+-sensing histidine kinase KdpD
MKLKWADVLRQPWALCCTGSAALALLTAICFRLHATPSVAAVLYTVVIVAVSLQGRFVPAIVVSLIAIGCLDYFFVAPVFRIAMAGPLDLAALITYLTTAIVITGLLSRLRKSLRELRRSEARLAEGFREGTLSLPIQQGLLRIAQEAISNALRHAKPTVVSVTLRADPKTVALEIRDNGLGIDNSRLESEEGLGISNMRNRARKLNAELDIRTAPGRGTSVLVQLPLQAADTIAKEPSQDVDFAESGFSPQRDGLSSS